MKRNGKITVTATIILLIAAGLYALHCFAPIELVEAENSAAKVFTCPITPDYGVGTVANVYFIVHDIDTSYLVNATTGVPAIDTTWSDAAITCAAGDITGAGTNVFTAACTMPPLDNKKRWAITGFENATPANTDTIKIPTMRYYPGGSGIRDNCTFSHTNFIIDNRVPVTTARIGE